jgi:hypothetical protein
MLKVGSGTGVEYGVGVGIGVGNTIVKDEDSIADNSESESESESDTCELLGFGVTVGSDITASWVGLLETDADGVIVDRAVAVEIIWLSFIPDEAGVASATAES